MAMTDAEQAVFNYIQQAYPSGLRGMASDSDAVIYKYDQVRAVVLSMFNENVKQGIREVVVQTTTEEGIEEWERYLGILVNPDFSLQVRRAAVLAKLVGTSPTIATIKSILDTLVGGHANTYTLHELYLEDESVDNEDTWTYEVRILAPVGNNFGSTDLIKILEPIQPAHCKLIVVIIPPIEDGFALGDSIDYRTDVPFDWADESAGALDDDGDWTDHDPFFQNGFIWTDDETTYPIVP